MKLSIVVPCLNEEGNLPLLYQEVAVQADGAADEWELILVDDGSTIAPCRPAGDRSRDPGCGTSP